MWTKKVPDNLTLAKDRLSHQRQKTFQLRVAGIGNLHRSRAATDRSVAGQLLSPGFV